MGEGSRVVHTAGVAHAKALGPGLGFLLREEDSVW